MHAVQVCREAQQVGTVRDRLGDPSREGGAETPPAARADHRQRAMLGDDYRGHPHSEGCLLALKLKGEELLASNVFVVEVKAEHPHWAPKYQAE